MKLMYKVVCKELNLTYQKYYNTYDAAKAQAVKLTTAYNKLWTVHAVTMR